MRQRVGFASPRWDVKTFHKIRCGLDRDPERSHWCGVLVVWACKKHLCIQLSGLPPEGVHTARSLNLSYMTGSRDLVHLSISTPCGTLGMGQSKDSEPILQLENVMSAGSCSTIASSGSERRKKKNSRVGVKTGRHHAFGVPLLSVHN